MPRGLVDTMITTLVATAALAALAASAWGESPPRESDYADGMAGGPDFWAVIGVPEKDVLNVRSGPSARDALRGALANDDVVRNLGCRMEQGSRWCRIKTLGDQPFEGWVNGRYLAESAGPEGDGALRKRIDSGPGGPELYVRPTGEVEVNFEGGCGALYDADGAKITSGLSCTQEQLQQARQAVADYLAGRRR